MKNRAAMKKAREEVRKVCGSKVRVEESDLPQLKYLNLVIKESLRLHPPSPLPAPRQTRQKCVIDGYTIPAKTVVFINATAIIGLQGDETFGDGAIWCMQEGEGALVSALLSTWLGRITLANLLQWFDWCFPQGMEAAELDMEEAVGLMNHRKAPLYLVAIPHEHNSTTNAWSFFVVWWSSHNDQLYRSNVRRCTREAHPHKLMHGSVYFLHQII